MKLTILDGRKMTDRRAARDYLAGVLQLPEYYGHNLDALADCLWERDSDELILVRHAAKIRENLLGYGDTLIEILQNASQENGLTVVVTEN